MELTVTFKYTEDWFSSKVPAWEKVLKNKWGIEDELTVIEVGVYEGRSSCWILENLFLNSKSKLYCIDTFQGSIEHSQEQTTGLHERFLHNIQQTKRIDQVTTLKGLSSDKLLELISNNIKADFIYIDGSHIAKDVLSDAVLSWKLLKQGGVMIFDDYLYRMHSDINMLPKIAIDSFVNIYLDEIIILKNISNAQFYIMKKPIKTSR